MKYDVIDLTKKTVGSIELNDKVFKEEVDKSILARTIQWQLDGRRQGTHATKDVKNLLNKKVQVVTVKV